MAEKIMYNLQEAADYTGLSYHFWWKACRRGDVRFIMAGNRYLIHKANIDDFLLHGPQTPVKKGG
ncbi:helix-turn-helix domain-containing protein [Hominifimenecus sp. rT4P-3]|uniref:helix-turn-helix domain-containing protein n=1 Tax=Hominifimenecus sp. rT4P-3 TaxID=3242979 RepID=UPI003DA221C4